MEYLSQTGTGLVSCPIRYEISVSDWYQVSLVGPIRHGISVSDWHLVSLMPNLSWNICLRLAPG